MTAFWILLLCAPSIGSFLGVLVTRLPSGRGVVFERSRCDACGAQLRFWEMFPILGWLFLRGRCARCGAKVSPFYPAIEIASVAVVFVAGFVFKGIALATACILGWLLLVATAIILRAKPAKAGYRLLLTGAASLGWVLWLGTLYAKLSS